MKKMFAAVMTAAFMLTAAMPAANAGLTRMDEAEMDQVTGRSGIRIDSEGVDFDMNIDTVYYKDDDGAGGQGEKPGYLTFSGIEMQGGIDFHNPVKIDVVTEPNAFSEVPVTSVNMEIDGMTLEVDRFSVDAIRVGDAPGEGPSFGAVEMSGMKTEVSGKVSVWAH